MKPFIPYPVRFGAPERAAHLKKSSGRGEAISLRTDIGGVAGIEFAMVSTILMILVAAGTDMGLAAYRHVQVANAARAAIDFVNANPTNCNSSGQSNACRTGVQSAGQSATSLGSNVSVTKNSSPLSPNTFTGCPTTSGITAQSSGTCSSGAPLGTYVTITATYNYSPIFPGIWTWLGIALTNNQTTFSVSATTRVS